MVNKYINTREIVREYQKAWWNNRYKKEIPIMCIVLLIEKPNSSSIRRRYDNCIKERFIYKWNRRRM